MQTSLAENVSRYKTMPQIDNNDPQTLEHSNKICIWYKLPNDNIYFLAR